MWFRIFLFFKHYISVSNFNWKSRSNRVAYCIARDKSIKTFQMMHRLKKSNVWFRCYDFFSNIKHPVWTGRQFCQVTNYSVSNVFQSLIWRRSDNKQLISGSGVIFFQIINCIFLFNWRSRFNSQCCVSFLKLLHTYPMTYKYIKNQMCGCEIIFLWPIIFNLWFEQEAKFKLISFV